MQSKGTWNVFWNSQQLFFLTTKETSLNNDIGKKYNIYSIAILITLLKARFDYIFG